MLEYGFSKDQSQLQSEARRFAQDVVRPAAARYDEEPAFAWPVVEQACERGLLNVMVPEKYGGRGLGALEACIVAEEVSWGCSGIAAAMDGNQLAAAPLILHGTEAQKDEYLGMLTCERGYAGCPNMAAYCISEPQAGSDVKAIDTTAELHGGHYVLDGTKKWITNASEASFFFVLAYTEPDAGYEGMTGFIVPADTQGIHVGAPVSKLGQRASVTRPVLFEHVEVPVDQVLGRETGQGWMQAMTALDKVRPVIAASAIGVARAAFELARHYAVERNAFGKPIAEHEAVQFMIAEMDMNIRAARHLVMEAAWLHDRGERNTREAAIARAFASETCQKVVADAMQVFGANGYSSEFPIGKLYRDAQVFQTYESTPQVHRMIIGREIFRAD